MRYLRCPLEQSCAKNEVADESFGLVITSCCRGPYGLGLAWGLIIMMLLHPLLKMLPSGKKPSAHEEGDGRAALAGHRPAKSNIDPASWRTTPRKPPGEALRAPTRHVGTSQFGL